MSARRGLAWLTAQPIAHRGLHDAAASVIENTPSAFRAAIEGGYGIECDVQVTRDGEAVVHHDDALGRLTEGDQALADLTAAELREVRFRNSDDRIATLGDLCGLVGGRVPLLVEIKARFDRDLRLTRRVADVLGAYKGAAAAMSFDPAVVQALREIAPALPRGIVAERYYRHAEWKGLSAGQKLQLGFLLHAPRTRPHFVAYSVKDLPSPAPLIARAFGLPLLTWTVRSADDRRTAARWADQTIFEGFRPGRVNVCAISA
jgi:glycerophosphoryl diester phosphodiesterase